VAAYQLYLTGGYPWNKLIPPELARSIAESLQDPTLTLHDGNGVEIARNDN